MTALLAIRIVGAQSEPMVILCVRGIAFEEPLVFIKIAIVRHRHFIASVAYDVLRIEEKRAVTNTNPLHHIEDRIVVDGLELLPVVSSLVGILRAGGDVEGGVGVVGEFSIKAYRRRPMHGNAFYAVREPIS